MRIIRMRYVPTAHLLRAYSLSSAIAVPSLPAVAHDRQGPARKNNANFLVSHHEPLQKILPQTHKFCA